MSGCVWRFEPPTQAPDVNQVLAVTAGEGRLQLDNPPANCAQGVVTQISQDPFGVKKC